MANHKAQCIFIVVLSVFLQLGKGVHSKGQDVADTSPGTKQRLFTAQRNPYVNRPWTQIQYSNWQRPRFPFYPQIPSIPATSRFTAPLAPDYEILLFVLLSLSRTNAASAQIPTESTTPTGLTTTASTAMPVTASTTADGCVWGNWGACSKTCRGRRTRLKTCNGIASETETEICNTETGEQTDGWYRASNCLEYLADKTLRNYADATANCEGPLNGRLAAIGMRNATTRFEILENLYQIEGTMFDGWIGVDNIVDINKYVWSDGHEETPTFWSQFQPSNDAHRCHVIILGNPHSLGDLSCTSNHDSFCEREIP